MSRFTDRTNARALPLDKLLESRNLTLIRDSTEAQDVLPFLLHLTKSLATVSKLTASDVLFITTRSRSELTSDETHIYPVFHRATASARPAFTALDPYRKFSTACLEIKQVSGKAINSFHSWITDTIRKNNAKVVIIECLQALKFTFGVCPSAYVRTLLSNNSGIAVIAAAPTECGVDGDVASLEDIADNVIDLNDLRTGAAVDVSGTYVMTKTAGKWAISPNELKYRATTSSFQLFT